MTISNECKTCKIKQSFEHDKTSNILVKDSPVITFQCGYDGHLVNINSYGKDILSIENDDITKVDILSILKLKNVDYNLLSTTESYDVTNAIIIDDSNITLIIKLIKNSELTDTIKGVCFNITEDVKSKQRLAELSNYFINFTPDPTTNIKKLTLFAHDQLGCDHITYQRYKLDEKIIISEHGDDCSIPECIYAMSEKKTTTYNNDLSYFKIKVTDLQTKCIQKINNDKGIYIIRNIICDNNTIGKLILYYKDNAKLNNNISWLIQIISSSIEIEERKYYDTMALYQANKILSTTTALASSIFNTKIINIDDILKMIGEQLSFEKINLIKFPTIYPYYKEWSRPHSPDKEELILYENEDYNIIELMEWVRRGETASINLMRYPSFFEPLVHSSPSQNKYKFLTPILINNKPWGILSIDENRNTPPKDITRSTLMNLGKIISILIREKEEQDELNNKLSEQISEFKRSIQTS